MDPPFVGRFVFDVGGVTIGAFTEVSGLSVQIDSEELAEGGQNQYTHKLPGRMKWPNLTLKRGITDNDALFEWLTQCSGDGLEAGGNKVPLKDGHVQLMDAAGKVVRKWTFTKAWPVKWTGPTFAASSRDLAVEQLEVCHCGFKSGK